MAATNECPSVFGVGIVGAGVIGTRLARAILGETNGEACVAAICDLNLEAANKLAKECEQAGSASILVTSDYKALIASEAVHVVYVGVPPSVHKPIALAAFAAQKHVICEKPLALSGADADEMAGAAEAAGVVSTVNLPFRQAPPVWAMCNATNPDGSGYVGTPVRVEIRFRFPQWPRAWQVAPWVGQRFQGGALREVGTHFYFLMGELFGGITRIRSTVVMPPAAPDAPGGGAAETSAVAQFTTKAGVPGTLDLLTGVAGNEQVICRVYGTEGTVTFTGWTELTGEKVGASIVSESGAFEGKKGRGRATESKREEEAGRLAGRSDMESSPEGLLLQRLIMQAKGSDACDAHISRPLVTFRQAAQAQHVLDAILSDEDGWVDVL